MDSVLIQLAGILLTLVLKNAHREKRHMERPLLSQANVLIRTLEAGSRTGTMEMGWGDQQIQLLMEETAVQPDVLYMAVVDGQGQVLAHNQRSLLGQVLPVAFPPPASQASSSAAGRRDPACGKR